MWGSPEIPPLRRARAGGFPAAARAGWGRPQDRSPAVQSGRSRWGPPQRVTGGPTSALHGSGIREARSPASETEAGLPPPGAPGAVNGLEMPRKIP
jgi:hypothetical protein